MLKIHVILILLISCGKLNSQNINRDSLLQILEKAKEDSNKVNLLFALGDTYESSSPDSALYYIRIGGDISHRINFTKGLQRYYRNISYVFVVQSLYDSVLYYNQKGLQVARINRDTFSIGVSLFNIGIAHRFKSAYDSAVVYSLEGVKLLEGKGYTNIESALYDGLQVLYMTLTQFDKAIAYGEKAVSSGRKLQNKNALAIALNNLSLSYMEVDKIVKAKEVLEEALLVAREIQNKSVEGSALNNLAEIALREGQLELLKKYTEQSLRVHTDIEAYEGIAVSLRGLGVYYLQQKEFAKAHEYCEQALAITEKHALLSEQSQCLNTLSSLAFAEHDFTQGYRYMFQAKNIESKILNESLVEKEAALKIKYETERKELKIKELETGKMIDQLAMEKKSIFNNILLATAIVLVIIFSLFYRNHKQNQKLQQQRINELETEKQLTATEAVLKGEEQERTRLAKDLHDGLGGMLSGIKYSFNTMKENLIMTPENHQAFERSMDMLDSSIKEMRRVAHNMMPESLIRFGLDTSLRDFCNDINQSGALDVSYQSINLQNVNLQQTTSITIYRIVQELINNILKHASAKSAIVQVTNTAGHIAVTVEDDGKGFDTAILNESKGIGWTNIQHRLDFIKAKLDVLSQPGKGTSIHIEFDI